VDSQKSILCETALKYIAQAKESLDKKYLNRLANEEAPLENFPSLLKKLIRILYSLLGKKPFL